MNKTALIICFIVVILAFLRFFYRLPEVPIRPDNTDTVYSPAFGRILKINRNEDSIFISIFLSPLDVHYQFAPVSGILSEIQYDATGKYALAYDLNKSQENEKAIYTIQNSRGTFKVFQIAGRIARRITILAKTQENIQTGQILGLIHFGSRVDIIVPVQKFNLQVREGQYVSGGKTVLGNYI